MNEQYETKTEKKLREIAWEMEREAEWQEEERLKEESYHSSPKEKLIILAGMGVFVAVNYAMVSAVFALCGF